MKKKPVILTINRRGEFQVLPEQFTLAQCGKNEKIDYKYHVSISATDERLIEPEMFVLENGLAHEYFINKYVEQKSACPSCELMACEAIEHFESQFKGKKAPYKFVNLKRIKVTIVGSDHSFIEGEKTY